MLAPPPALRPDETARLEQLEVLGDRLSRQAKAMVHGQRGAELEECLPVPGHEGVQDGPSGGGSERLVDVGHGQ